MEQRAAVASNPNVGLGSASSSATRAASPEVTEDAAGANETEASATETVRLLIEHAPDLFHITARMRDELLFFHKDTSRTLINALLRSYCPRSTSSSANSSPQAAQNTPSTTSKDAGSRRSEGTLSIAGGRSSSGLRHAEGPASDSRRASNAGQPSSASSIGSVFFGSDYPGHAGDRTSATHHDSHSASKQLAGSEPAAVGKPEQHGITITVSTRSSASVGPAAQGAGNSSSSSTTTPALLSQSSPSASPSLVKSMPDHAANPKSAANRVVDSNSQDSSPTTALHTSAKKPLRQVSLESLPPPPYPDDLCESTDGTASQSHDSNQEELEPLSDSYYEQMWALPPLHDALLQELASAWDRATCKALRSPAGLPPTVPLGHTLTSQGLYDPQVPRASNSPHSPSASISPRNSPRGSSSSLRVAPVRRHSSSHSIGALSRQSSGQQSPQSALSPISPERTHGAHTDDLSGEDVLAPLHGVQRKPQRRHSHHHHHQQQPPLQHPGPYLSGLQHHRSQPSVPSIGPQRSHNSIQQFELSDSDSEPRSRLGSIGSRPSICSDIDAAGVSDSHSCSRKNSSHGRRTVTESHVRQLMTQGYSTVV